MIPNEQAVMAMTGIEFFGLKILVMVPEHLDIDPHDAAEGFTKSINDMVKRANQPTPRKLCEMAAKRQLGMN